MGKILLIPGYRGSEPGHWQRDWARQDGDAEIVEQEDWDRPFLAQWLAVLEASLAENPGAVLVAHSLGCALVAHLGDRPSAAHVAGALLVAPADLDILAKAEPHLAPFGAFPDAPLPFRSIVVASRDDPFMTFGRAKAHADRWGSGFVDYGRAGHINTASGFGPWPDGAILVGALSPSAGRGEQAQRRETHGTGRGIAARSIAAAAPSRA